MKIDLNEKITLDYENRIKWKITLDYEHRHTVWWWKVR